MTNLTNEELLNRLQNSGGTALSAYQPIIADVRAELLRRLGAAVSASPQPSVDIKQKCINFICQNPYPAWDQLVELVESCFAAAPAQEPERPGRTKLLMKFWSAMHLAGFAKDKEWDAQERINIQDLVKLMAESAAQEQPVENSPQAYQKAIQELQIVKFVSDGDGDWIAVRKHGFDKLRALAKGKL